MLYSGQEVGLDKRLKFFEKDSIDWSDPKQFQPFYKKLVSLHRNNQALWGGEYGGMAVRINNEDPDVYAFQRTKDKNKIIGILNFSDKEQELKLIDNGSAGSYQDYFTDETYELSTTKPLKLSPWQYLIFVTPQ
jgi:glycosidase